MFDNLIEDNVSIDNGVAGQGAGILVAGGLPPGPPNQLPPAPAAIKNTVIRGNRIFDDTVGIWTLGVDPATTTISHNFFGPGVTPVVTN